MAQVIKVQKPDSGTKDVLTIGGGVAGGIVGSGSPGAIGAGAGAGSTAGNFLDPTQPPAPTLSGGGEASAMARRLQAASQDNLATLKQAEATLPQLPEALRQAYAPAIVQARMLEQQKRGGA